VDKDDDPSCEYLQAGSCEVGSKLIERGVDVMVSLLRIIGCISEDSWVDTSFDRICASYDMTLGITLRDGNIYRC
jgi:hypothetical protein